MIAGPVELVGGRHDHHRHTAVEPFQRDRELPPSKRPRFHAFEIGEAEHVVQEVFDESGCGAYSRSRSWWFIASMSEIAHTFRGIERPNIRPDTSLQSVDCALRSFAQQCLERVENQLYGVKVRRILRQVAETCTSSADHL